MSPSSAHPSRWREVASQSTVELLRQLAEIDEARLRLSAEADLISDELSKRRASVAPHTRPDVTIVLDVAQPARTGSVHNIVPIRPRRST